MTVDASLLTPTFPYFFILLLLYEPRHGYAVMQFIEQQAEGRLKPGAGSLYGALNNLTEKGWIEPLDEADRRRRDYQITLQGRHVVKGEIARLHQLTAFAEGIVGGNNA